MLSANVFIAERGGGKITDQLIAIIVLGAMTFVLPAVLNKWSDTRAGVR